MRLPLAASLFLTLGLIHPACASAPEDLEGSGYDLDGSGSGSGDGSEQGEIENLKDQHTRKDGRIVAAEAAKRNANAFHGISCKNFSNTHWPAIDSDSGYAHSKRFLQNKEVTGVIIAGGVVGLALAATVAGVLIYKWQKKDEERYILGQQKASDDYHKPNREEIFV